MFVVFMCEMLFSTDDSTSTLPAGSEEELEVLALVLDVVFVEVV